MGKKAPTPEHKAVKPPHKGGWVLFALAPFLLGSILLLTIPQSGFLQLQRDPCAAAKTKLKSFTPLFPIIPNELTKINDTGEPENLCTPANWDRTIIVLLIYRGLGLLNYVAGAIAILATLWGGALYLFSQGQSEQMKNAKTLIIGTYVGFLIVLCARLMVNATFYIFGTGTNFDLIDQFETDKIKDPTPTPTP